RVLSAPRIELVQSRSHLLDGDSLLELLDHHRAAGELDAFGDALDGERHETGNDDDPRQTDRLPAPAEEVVVRVLENLHGVPKCSTSLRPSAGSPAPARRESSTRTQT